MVVFSKPLQVEEDEPNFGCGFCTKSYRTRTSLQQHIKQAHSEPATCGVCHKTFKSKHHLKLHEYVHAEPNLICPHPDCNAVFKRKMSLSAHIQTHADNRQTFNCTECSKTYLSKMALKWHFKQKHPDSDRRKLDLKVKRKLFCKDCWIFFEDRKSLNAHKALCSETEYFCSYCGLAFVKEEEQKIHEKIHLKEGKQLDVVENCAPKKEDIRPNVASTSKEAENGQKRRRQSLSKKQQENDQDQKVIKKKRLVANIRKVKQESAEITATPDSKGSNKTLANKCPKCDKLFVHLGALEFHYLTHRSGNLYKCPQEGCTKSFQTKGNLSYHMLNHSLPYECGCGSKFPHKRALTTHVESGNCKALETFAKMEPVPKTIVKKAKKRLDLGLPKSSPEDAEEKIIILKVKDSVTSPGPPVLTPYQSPAQQSTNTSQLIQQPAASPSKIRILGQTIIPPPSTTPQAALPQPQIEANSPLPADVAIMMAKNDKVTLVTMPTTPVVTEPKYRCSICGFTFFTDEALKIHLRLHAANKSFYADIYALLETIPAQNFPKSVAILETNNASHAMPILMKMAMCAHDKSRPPPEQVIIGDFANVSVNDSQNQGRSEEAAVVKTETNLEKVNMEIEKA